jgi:3-keto-5-aminohexanoate cleavage enzyme
MSDPTKGLAALKMPNHDVRDVCVVTCALTGVLANRDQCKNLPYTPAEIGEEARRAYEAGV